MELTTLYRLIGLQPEIVERLKPFHTGSDRMRLGPYLERLTMPETAQEAYLSLKEVLGEDPDGLAMLYCQLEAARQVYRRYQEKGIPERIFVDTMRCFPRFIAECEKKDGRLLFDRGWWSYRQTSMCLFRIGALEYEFRKHEGEPAVALHIPSGADLSEPAVNDSLEQAGRFFQTHYQDYKYSRYICISWLLSPALEPLLSETSRIRSFQQRFEIVQTYPENMEFIELLFQVPRTAPYGSLPETTSLQRGVKALLLGGGMVGSAYGTLERQKYGSEASVPR